mmetsp:Transcript_11059/g.17037  ORF Transcript_11059/g.17037 Transcript_11059/m.17037 type:complete len:138 (+) Transcript_11059:82-495(+)
MNTLKPRHGTPLKVHQDDTRPGKGNALQAAVASIFGLSLSQVPNFIEMPDGYETAIQKFCQGGGCNCAKVMLADNENVMSEYDQKLCILRGKSPRGNFGHVVVAKIENNRFVMLHDPHPDCSFLDEKEQFVWCMLFW